LVSWSGGYSLSGTAAPPAEAGGNNARARFPAASGRQLIAGEPTTPPADDLGDAFHLALATWYRIQYLLTWNCKHLANANQFEHIQVLNTRRRLVSPALITPAQLLAMEP
jgi:hypothetical protein